MCFCAYFLGINTGFNRTFMELKSGCDVLRVRRPVRFNRTFMELKYG